MNVSDYDRFRILEVEVMDIESTSSKWFDGSSASIIHRKIRVNKAMKECRGLARVTNNDTHCIIATKWVDDLRDDLEILSDAERLASQTFDLPNSHWSLNFS